jgi:hypothetical protein
VASNEMGYHLFHCGSKTVQCPNCFKYIHRANYTFHLDNNCIDLDEDDDIQIDNEEELIPCEVCDEQIKFSSYTYHLVLFNRLEFIV